MLLAVRGTDRSRETPERVQRLVREGHPCLGSAGSAVENRPGLLMVAEHSRSIDAVSLGEDDLETRRAVAEQRRRFEFVKKLSTASMLGTS